ncbi:MAG: hypothetical protein ABW328_20500 [Ilumatobacteraceae bacterium]
MRQDVAEIGSCVCELAWRVRGHDRDRREHLVHACVHRFGATKFELGPSWFVVANDDHTIPPDAQRFLAERADADKTIEVRASHVVMISKPGPVANLIVAAARYDG